jgi:hypothetical protein
MEKLCLECKAIVKGRSDKKFCDDHCRSSYYNRHKIEENSLTKNVNQILKKNRQVLSNFNPDGKTRINRNELIAAGLNLKYHTQTHHTRKGHTYIFCYEYGYVDLGGEEFLLVKKAAV